MTSPRISAWPPAGGDTTHLPALLRELHETTYGSSQRAPSKLRRQALSQLRELIPHTYCETLTFDLVLRPNYKRCHIMELLSSSKRVKTTNIKPEIALALRVIRNTVHNKCHTHRFFFPFLSLRFIFKGGPNLENLGTKPLAFYRLMIC